MAYKITISGEIGWDYTAQDIRDSLLAANGDDLDIDIVTPGGDVFDGVEIFNMILGYKEDHPKAQISMLLDGLVASMGTYIASNPAVDLVSARSNAIYMIHNPWNGIWGDYNDMKENAEFLSGLTKAVSEIYVQKTSKSPAEIRAMMDKTTWLYGQDIIDAGFADILIPIDGSSVPAESSDEKDKALSMAKMKYDAMISAQAKRTDPKRDRQRAAALVHDLQASLPGLTGSNDTAPSQGGKEDIEVKNLSEFMAQGKEAFAEVEAVKADAIKAERERVAKLSDMRAKFSKVGAIAEMIDAAVADGKSFADISESVLALALAAAESPPPVNTGSNGTASGEQVAATPDGFIPIQIIQ